MEKYDYTTFGVPTITGPGPDGAIGTPDDVILNASAFGNPYTYTGREFDPESGLYYYRARYYDPRIGRFLQEDPFNLANVQLPVPMFPEIFKFSERDEFLAFRVLDENIELLIWNSLQLMQYHYVLNNPINLTDPTGLATDWDKVGECVGGLIIPALAATCGPSVKLGPEAALACTLFVEAGLLAGCIQFASKPDCDTQPNERKVKDE